MHGRVTALLLTALALTCLAGPAQAKVDKETRSRRRGVSDRFNLSLGTFLVSFDTAARVDSEFMGPGTPVDLEDVFDGPLGHGDAQRDDPVRR